MNSYHFMRRVHLFTGLGLLVFIAMYFATGYVMIHEKWFTRSNPAPAVRTESLGGINVSAPGETVSRDLQDRFDLRGKRGPAVTKPDGSRQFSFSRPGTSYSAVISPGGNQVKITEKRTDKFGLAGGFHRLHGYGGGWLFAVWGLVCDLASAAMIVFAGSGIYLWYRASTRRLPGVICLCASFGFAAATVLAFLYG